MLKRLNDHDILAALLSFVDVDRLLVTNVGGVIVGSSFANLVVGALVLAVATAQTVAVDSPEANFAVPARDAVAAAVEGEETGWAAVPGEEVETHGVMFDAVDDDYDDDARDAETGV
ncbi:hypothetical protein PT974_10950 [Cladobotryum mycophilum]|uniref:Sodium/calcium exchanger membrane region domain-containing protein n=1 Tax=Cladobotryum mycophilum TaxID=491253 RepID=A0ABR0SC52_9HYPO